MINIPYGAGVPFGVSASRWCIFVKIGRGLQGVWKMALEH